MDLQLTHESRFWAAIDQFVPLAEQVLCSGASLSDAEDLLLGWPAPGHLPLDFACLTGGKAYLQPRP